MGATGLVGAVGCKVRLQNRVYSRRLHWTLCNSSTDGQNEHKADMIAKLFWHRALKPQQEQHSLSIKGTLLPQPIAEAADPAESTRFQTTLIMSMFTGLLGSEQQKQELLPRLAKLEWTGAWALTEPSNGSDASALQTTAREVTHTASESHGGGL